MSFEPSAKPPPASVQHHPPHWCPITRVRTACHTDAKRAERAGVEPLERAARPHDVGDGRNKVSAVAHHHAAVVQDGLRAKASRLVRGAVYKEQWLCAGGVVGGSGCMRGVPRAR
jgi:hypothetical protein